MDLTGLDVSQPVMESIYHQFYEEPRFRPSPLLVQRKVGGLARSQDGPGLLCVRRRRDAARQPPPAPDARPASVWIVACRCAGACGARCTGGDARRGASTAAIARAADALCIVAPLGSGCHDRGARREARRHRAPSRSTPASDLASHRTLMTTPVDHTGDARGGARAVRLPTGSPVSVIRDSAGFVAQRVVAHIVNIACDIAQQRIATPQDIERAVTLGLGYRRVPLADGRCLGAGNDAGHPRTRCTSATATRATAPAPGSRAVRGWGCHCSPQTEAANPATSGRGRRSCPFDAYCAPAGNVVAGVLVLVPVAADCAAVIAVALA